MAETRPNQGLCPIANEGLSLPIGKGFLIDERRLAVRQANIYQQIATAEQAKMINKILITALKDYWEWPGGSYFCLYFSNFIPR